MENRARIRPIVESIIFLGKQNISFRGHRDFGKLDLDYKKNDGNFRCLLKHRVNFAGDENLKEHILKSSLRATYLSPETHNIIIECSGQEILSKVSAKVQAAKIYSIMFHKTTDLSNLSQECLLIRYTHANNIYESCLKFIDIRAIKMDSDDEESKLTGKNVGKSVIQKL